MIKMLRNLIKKIPHQQKTDKLLEQIDIYGLERIRSNGSPINNIVYHTVFYQAMDDQLRVIYSKILK